MAESWEITDGNGAGIGDGAGAFLMAYDGADVGTIMLLTDPATFTQAMQGSNLHAFLFSNPTNTGILQRVTEALETADTATPQLSVLVEYRLGLGANETETTAQTRSVTEPISIAHLVYVVAEAAVTNAITASTPVTITRSFIVEIINAVVSTGLHTDIAAIQHAVAFALAIADTYRVSYDSTVTHQIRFSNAYVAALTTTASVLNAYKVANTHTPQIVLQAVMAEEMEIDDAATSTQVMQAALDNGIRFVVAGQFSDTDEFTGICMNLENAAVSEYSNFVFNSFAPFDGYYYAASDAGIFRLGGDTDAGSPILARLKTGLTDFGSSHKKQMVRAWLNFRNDGAILLKVSNGEQQQTEYRLTNVNDRIHPDRFVLGRGLKHVYWQFELSNTSAGADFEIDRLEVYPLVLQRKVF